MITTVVCSTWPEMRRRTVTRGLWEEGQVLADLIPSAYFDRPHLACIRNGRAIPREEWERTPTVFGDFVTWVPLPGDLVSAALFIGELVATALIAAGISYGIQALLGQPKEQEIASKDDQTTVLTGAQNTAYSGAPIAIVYGEQVIAGTFLEVSVEGNNPFLTQQPFGNLLDLTIGLCEGEIDEILEVKINGNPLATYNYPPDVGETSPIQLFSNVGTLDQVSLGGFGSAATFPVDLELPMGSGDPAVPATWIPGEVRSYTTTQAVDRVQVNILHPEGLVAIHHTDLAQWPLTVEWEIRWRAEGSGSGGWTPWFLFGATSNVSTPFITSSEVVFHVGGVVIRGVYDLEIRRRSVIIEAWNLKHRIDFDSVTEVLDTQFTYPGIACLRLRIEAGKDLQGSLPTITARIRGRKIVKWDGVDPDAPVFVDAYPYDNPAWVALDELTDGIYGLGRWYSIENVDLPSLKEWADWCDELVPDGFGGEERRCTYSAVLDGQNIDAWARLEQITRTCRATVVPVGDLLKFKVNKPRAPIAKFGMGSIRPGSWKQTWVTSRLRPTRLNVRYLSKELGFQVDEEGIDDEQSILEGLPQKIETVDLMGISRRSQALREARFLLNLGKLTEIVEWGADIDGIACEVGDLVLLSHDLPAWGLSGRILEDSPRGSNVILDREVTIEDGVTYRVIVRHLDGTIEDHAVLLGAGTYPPGTTIPLDTTFAQLPAKGVPYAFGRTENVARIVQITDIVTHPNLTRDFQGFVYDERIHDDGIGELDPIVATDLPDPGTIPPCPSGLTVTQANVLVGGAAVFQIQVSWSWPIAQIDRALVYYRAIDSGTQGGGAAPTIGAWTLAGAVLFPLNSYTHPVAPGTYEFTVVCEGPTGGSRPVGTCETAQIVVSEALGVTPFEVTGISVSHAGDDLIIDWDPVTNVPISHYLVRRGSHWVGSIPVGQVTGTEIVTPRWAPNAGSAIGETFFVRAVSYAGVIGYTGQLTVAAPGLPIWAGGSVDQSDEGDSSWPGGMTNLVEVGTRLELVTPGDPGEYITNIIDGGATDTYRVGAIVHFGQESAIKFSSSIPWSGSVGWSECWDGPIDPAQWPSEFRVEVQSSANGLAWSDWSPLVTQTVTGATIGGAWVAGVRYFRVRVTMVPSDPAYRPYLENLFITVEAR